MHWVEQRCLSKGVHQLPLKRSMNRQQIRRNARIEHHMQLVEPLARRYAKKSGQDQDDLLQVGLMGLLRTAERYEGQGTILSQPFREPILEG